MDWQLSEIREKVRDLTGRPSTSQISNDALKTHINEFYRNKLPLLLLPENLKGWYEKTLTAGTDTYTLDEDYLYLDPPYTINGAFCEFYQDKYTFYAKWPETQTWTASTPYGVLFYNRKLIFRPPPDALDTYKFKAATLKKPTALSQDSDKPLNPMWGPVIAYGAAIEIKEDAGEDVEGLPNMLTFHVRNAGRQELIYLMSQRSDPKF